MEEDIEMEELESIMSLDMDFFDEPPAVKSEQDQTLMQSSHQKKHSVDTVEASSASKRQRLHFEDGTDRRQQREVKENSEKPEQPAVSTKTKEHPQMSSSTTTKAFDDIEVRCYFRL